MSTRTAAPTPSIRRLLLAGLVAGGLSAMGVTFVAAMAHSAGVPFTVDGERIELPAFTLWVLVGTAIGVVLARCIHDRRRFFIVTVIGTALSLIPALLLPDDASTRVALVVIHLLAAGIIIPILSRALYPAPLMARPD
ncbi:MAG TPA: DUF6069 family protein [Thermomicrobiales bacterium]|nr:DUF6069 family protein [Thermomicrobiales bacterium]